MACEGKTLFVPRIDPDVEGKMDFVKVYGEEDLQSFPEGLWGIKEPTSHWDGRVRPSGECHLLVGKSCAERGTYSAGRSGRAPGSDHCPWCVFSRAEESFSVTFTCSMQVSHSTIHSRAWVTERVTTIVSSQHICPCTTQNLCLVGAGIIKFTSTR